MQEDLTNAQVLALRKIIRPEYKCMGCPCYLINTMVISALVRKGLIKISKSRSSGKRVIINKKYREVIKNGKNIIHRGR